MKAALLFVLFAGVNSTIGNLLLKASGQNVTAGSNLVDQYVSLQFIGALSFYSINLILFAKALDYFPIT